MINEAYKIWIILLDIAINTNIIQNKLVSVIL